MQYLTSRILVWRELTYGVCDSPLGVEHLQPELEVFVGGKDVGSVGGDVSLGPAGQLRV